MLKYQFLVHVDTSYLHVKEVLPLFTATFGLIENESVFRNDNHLFYNRLHHINPYYMIHFYKIKKNFLILCLSCVFVVKNMGEMSDSFS